MSYFLKNATIGFSLLILSQCLGPGPKVVSANSGRDKPKVILKGEHRKLLLPSGLEQLLRKRFWRYDLPTHFMGDRWSQFSRTRVVPYATWGDFNGDGLTDVALLLSQSRPPHKSYWWSVFVFHKDAQGQFSGDTAFELEEFRHDSTKPMPIQSYRIALYKAGTSIQTDHLTLPYTYPLDSIALLRLEPRGEEIERIYAWDPKLSVIRRTILDALGKEAVVKSPVFDRPKVVGSGTERTLVLPWALKAMLAKDYGDLRLPGPIEMSKGRWAEFTVPDRVPWGTWADYNGDGLTDIAFALVDRETGGARRWSPVAFLQTDNHSFEAYELERFHETVGGSHDRVAGNTLPASPPQGYVLVTVPAGSKSLGRSLGSWPDGRYRFDTILLTRLPERPLNELKGAIIHEWLPRWTEFTNTKYGTMTD